MALEQEARKVVETLRRAGHTAFYAGGCVRDMLLDRGAHDIDIATDAPPERVQELFPKTVAVGAHFGVVIVHGGAHAFEVATFRSDGPYLDGRRPTAVTFTNAEGDARRRDFTVNGLFFDPVDRVVIDHVGGRADLEARILRAIGDPALRFAEDRLRVLRGVRFAAVLGFGFAGGTWEAMCAAAADVAGVSAERVRGELVKIFTGPWRGRGFDLLAASGLMRVLLPEVADLEGCDQPPEFHPEGDVFVHTRMMLDLLPVETSASLAFAVLLHDIGKPPCRSVDPNGRIRFNGHEHVGARMAEDVMHRLRFSNRETAATVEMVRNHMAFKDTPRMRAAKLRRFMARDTFDEELELHRVDCLASHGGLDIHAFLREKQAAFASEPLIPPRLLTGADLIALGWKPGPAFREALEAVQTRQLEGKLTTREEALTWIAKNSPPAD
jgi:tRNA nucleotidyltransferase/poly(A) polymerase